MSESNRPASAKEFLAAIQAQFEKQKRTEDERRARLTPAQRKAEDDKVARERREEKELKLEKKVRAAAAPYCHHGSFTIMEFASLLSAVSPEDYNPWLVNLWTDNAAIERIAAVLGSCVRFTSELKKSLPLYPVNPDAPADKMRFAREDLMLVALAKQLGHAVLLAQSFRVQTQPAETTEPSAHALATASSEAAASPSGSPESAGDSASTCDWHSVADAVVKGLIDECDRLNGQPITRDALPFTHTDVLERFERHYRSKKHRVPVGQRTLQGYVSKRFRLLTGTRGAQDAELLSKLRKLPIS